MRLVPTQSPGRGTRKARDFGSEIVELRAQGYTLDAIRSALADAGVHVTISTVWREANRVKAPPRGKPIAQISTPSPSPAQPSQPAVQRSGSATAARSVASQPAERADGKKQAELFMSTQITNPLIRSKEQR
jgi:hypothetical protein